MSTDNYASEEETLALIVPDTRTPAEKRLHKLIEAESVPELCGSDYPDALYKAAVKLAGQTAPMKQEPEVVQRIKRYAGQTMRTARNPNITARECIELAGWIAANTSPQPAQRKPLTVEQKLMCWARATHDADVEHKTEHQCLMDYATEIEEAHNIKESK